MQQERDKVIFEVKAFETLESQKENGGEEKDYQKDELMTEENPTFQFEEVRENRMKASRRIIFQPFSRLLRLSSLSEEA